MRRTLSPTFSAASTQPRTSCTRGAYPLCSRTEEADPPTRPSATSIRVNWRPLCGSAPLLDMANNSQAPQLRFVASEGRLALEALVPVAGDTQLCISYGACSHHDRNSTFHLPPSTFHLPPSAFNLPPTCLLPQAPLTPRSSFCITASCCHAPPPTSSASSPRRTRAPRHRSAHLLSCSLLRSSRLRRQRRCSLT